jgi:hypothetical protein
LADGKVSHLDPVPEEEEEEEGDTVRTAACPVEPTLALETLAEAVAVAPNRHTALIISITQSINQSISSRTELEIIKQSSYFNISIQTGNNKPNCKMQNILSSQLLHQFAQFLAGATALTHSVIVPKLASTGSKLSCLFFLVLCKWPDNLTMLNTLQ